MEMSKFNICLIGTSHTACFRTGWRNILADYPDVSISFYPYPGADYFHEFRADPEAGILRMENENVRKHYEKISGHGGEIDFARFDLCLIVGEIIWWNGYDRRRFSEQVGHAALFAFLRKTRSYKLFHEIRKASALEVFISHIPFTSSRRPSLRRNVDSYLAEVDLVNEDLLKSQNARLLPQPGSTIHTSGLCTKLEYAVGRRVKNPDDTSSGRPSVLDDLWHMNERFGEVQLREILEAKDITPRAES